MYSVLRDMIKSTFSLKPLVTLFVNKRNLIRFVATDL